MVRRGGLREACNSPAPKSGAANSVTADAEPLDANARHQAKLCDLARKVPTPKKTSNDQLYQRQILERQAMANTIDLLWKYPSKVFECHAWLMGQIFKQPEADDDYWDESYIVWSRVPWARGGGVRAKRAGVEARAPAYSLRVCSAPRLGNGGCQCRRIRRMLLG